MLLEKDCFDNVAFKREFLDFQYSFQKVTAISFYCIQYYDYNHRFLYSFETSWDISFIVSESKKLAANKLNEILSDKRRTIRKTKMRKRKNLNTEKWLV